jgi:hypothetical protein
MKTNHNITKNFSAHKANSETIRFHVLSVISECVTYCLAGENLDHPFTQFAVRLPSRTRLAALSRITCWRPSSGK